MVSNIPVLDFPKQGESKQLNEFFYRKHLEEYFEAKVQAWVEERETWADIDDTNEGDFLEVLKKNEGELKSNEIVKSITLCYNLSRLEIIDDTL